MAAVVDPNRFVPLAPPVVGGFAVVEPKRLPLDFGSAGCDPNNPVPLDGAEVPSAGFEPKSPVPLLVSAGFAPKRPPVVVFEGIDPNKPVEASDRLIQKDLFHLMALSLVFLQVSSQRD